MDEPRVCHTQWKKSEGEKQILAYRYGIYKNEPICKVGIETQIQRTDLCTQKGKTKAGQTESSTDIYMLPCVKHS